MRKNRVVLALAVASVALVTMSGCSVPNSGAGAGGSTASPGAGGGGPANTLLGIVTISATDANNARVIKGATAAAEEAGWTVEVIDAAGNADQANTAITNFVNKGAGMIFDLVFPASSLGAGLNAAKAAGIPVATWGGGIADGVVMTTGTERPSQSRPPRP